MAHYGIFISGLDTSVDESALTIPSLVINSTKVATTGEATITISFTISNSSFVNMDPSTVSNGQAFIPSASTGAIKPVDGSYSLTWQQIEGDPVATATLTFDVEGGKLGGPGALLVFVEEQI